MEKRIILAVTNDLTGDQRAHKVAMTLVNAGHQPVLVGRKLPFSLPLTRPYHCLRFRLPFRKGPLFYLSYNLRLFLFLLAVKADIFLANDLDTLPAVRLAGWVRRKRIVYDSHEYFTQVPELVNRRFARKTWELAERMFFPEISSAYTVNQSISDIYSSLYHLDVKVIRNLPPAEKPQPREGFLPDGFIGFKLILYQGAVNEGRGLAEMIRAMVHLEEFRLVVIGDGDIREDMENLVHDLGVQNLVHFTGRLPFEDLAWYTNRATIGISLEQNIGLNYYYSLPNKVFDYLHAGLPILASSLPEIRQIVEAVDFGILVDRYDPLYLAETVRRMTGDDTKMKQWRDNALNNKGSYTWESQEKELLELIVGD
jgi:glycosyltransferase involved in cell wall biosynthesis